MRAAGKPGQRYCPIYQRGRAAAARIYAAGARPQGANGIPPLDLGCPPGMPSRPPAPREASSVALRAPFEASRNNRENRFGTIGEYKVAITDGHCAGWRRWARSDHARLPTRLASRRHLFLQSMPCSCTDELWINMRRNAFRLLRELQFRYFILKT